MEIQVLQINWKFLVWLIGFIASIFAGVKSFIKNPDILSFLSALLTPISKYMDNSPGSGKGSKKKIAIIFKSPGGYCKRMERAIRECLKPHKAVDYEFKVPEKFESVSEQHAYIRQLIDSKPDGVILTPPKGADELVPDIIKLLNRGLPVVILDDEFDIREFLKRGSLESHLPIFVRCDQEKGGELAAEAILQAIDPGDTIAVISGPKESRTSKLRKHAFVDHISRHVPKPIIPIVETDWSELQGERAMKEILKINPPVKAVFVCSNRLTIGALQATEAIESEIPIIVSYDGIDSIRNFIMEGKVYASVDINIEEQAMLAVDELVRIVTSRKRLKSRQLKDLIVQPTLLKKETIFDKTNPSGSLFKRLLPKA